MENRSPSDIKILSSSSLEYSRIDKITYLRRKEREVPLGIAPDDIPRTKLYNEQYTEGIRRILLWRDQEWNNN